jgi:ubiquitin carboxyl-terminal hydrolase 40
MPHPEPDHHVYELYGVVIHRGSAHGGHYICYVRDLMH